VTPVDYAWPGGGTATGFVVTGTGATGDFVFINGMQIAAVPEPGSLGMLGVAALIAVWRSRRIR